MHRTMSLGLCVSVLVAAGCGGNSAPSATSPSARPSAGVLRFTLSAGRQSVAMVTADLNGDGYPDLVLLEVSGSGGANPEAMVSVFLGPFQQSMLPTPSETYAVPADAVSLAVADLNSDGAPDLLVGRSGVATGGSSSYGGIHLIFRGPAGNATGESDVLAGLDAQSIRAGDVDGDGRMDIVAAGPGYLYIARGLGGGTFADPVHMPLWGAWTLGNFGGDGHASIAVQNPSDNTRADVYAWVSDSGLVLQTSVSFTLAISVLVAADVNQHGSQDLVAGLADAASNGRGGVGVAVRTGAFIFSSLVETLVGAVGTLVVGDFNQDGITDLAVSSPAFGPIACLLGDGTGHFQQSGSMVPAGTWSRVAAGDLDGDGRADLIVCGDQTAIYFSPGWF